MFAVIRLKMLCSYRLEIFWLSLSRSHMYMGLRGRGFSSLHSPPYIALGVGSRITLHQY